MGDRLLEVENTSLHGLAYIDVIKLIKRCTNVICFLVQHIGMENYIALTGEYSSLDPQEPPAAGRLAFRIENKEHRSLGMTIKQGTINVVDNVVPESPACLAGLMPADEILEINNCSVLDMLSGDFIKQLNSSTPETITLQVYRASVVMQLYSPATNPDVLFMADFMSNMTVRRSMETAIDAILTAQHNAALRDIMNYTPETPTSGVVTDANDSDESILLNPDLLPGQLISLSIPFVTAGYGCLLGGGYGAEYPTRFVFIKALSLTGSAKQTGLMTNDVVLSIAGVDSCTRSVSAAISVVSVIAANRIPLNITVLRPLASLLNSQGDALCPALFTVVDGLNHAHVFHYLYTDDGQLKSVLMEVQGCTSPALFGNNAPVSTDMIPVLFPDGPAIPPNERHVPDSSPHDYDQDIGARESIVTLEVTLTKGSSGLGLALKNDGSVTLIAAVAPNGVADMDGRLRAGDKIIAVDGTPLLDLDYGTILGMLKIARGAVTFEVSRIVSTEDRVPVNATDCVGPRNEVNAAIVGIDEQNAGRCAFNAAISTPVFQPTVDFSAGPAHIVYQLMDGIQVAKTAQSGVSWQELENTKEMFLATSLIVSENNVHSTSVVHALACLVPRKEESQNKDVTTVDVNGAAELEEKEEEEEEEEEDCPPTPPSTAPPIGLAFDDVSISLPIYSSIMTPPSLSADLTPLVPRTDQASFTDPSVVEPQPFFPKSMFVSPEYLDPLTQTMVVLKTDDTDEKTGNDTSSDCSFDEGWKGISSPTRGSTVVADFLSTVTVSDDVTVSNDVTASTYVVPATASDIFTISDVAGTSSDDIITSGDDITILDDITISELIILPLTSFDGITAFNDITAPNYDFTDGMPVTVSDDVTISDDDDTLLAKPPYTLLSTPLDPPDASLNVDDMYNAFRLKSASLLMPDQTSDAMQNRWIQLERAIGGHCFFSF